MLTLSGGDILAFAEVILPGKYTCTGFYKFEVSVSTINIISYKAVNCNINYLLTPWLYSPLGTLASFKADTHPLLFAFCLQLFTFSSHKSFSASPSHLSLTFQVFLQPSTSFSSYSQHCFISIYTDGWKSLQSLSNILLTKNNCMALI